MTVDDANRLLALVLDCSRGVRSPLELMDAVRALGHTVELIAHARDDVFTRWTCSIDRPEWELPLSCGNHDAAAAVRAVVCKLVQSCRPSTTPA